jgi:purine nucleosidase
MPDPLRAVVDTDTASDDALALVLAAQSERLSLEAVTTVAGNVSLARATANAKHTLGVAGVDPPVHEGASRPLLKEFEFAEDVHGTGGLGAVTADPDRPSAGGHAADAIVDRARGDADVLVCLGPLTNVALALTRDPDLGDHLDAVWVMGGAANCLGNVTPAAEYNFWVDPDAATVVLRDLEVTLVDWGVSRRAGVLPGAAYERLAALDTDLARFAVDSATRLREVTREREGTDGAVHPDGLALACVLGLPHEAAPRYVDVDERAGMTRGYSLVDEAGVLEADPNGRVVTGADGDRFVEAVLAACRGDPPETAF